MSDELRRLSRDDVVALIGEDTAWLHDAKRPVVLVTDDTIKIKTDPSIPPGVIEIRRGDKVLGRVFAFGATT